MKNMPTHYAPSFICPFCNTYSRFTWSAASSSSLKSFTFATCDHCKETTIWKKGKMILPAESVKYTISPPCPDMPQKAKAFYNEAKEIVDSSPRSSCSMLRLALQYMCLELGCKGQYLNEDIAELVSRGLPEHTQQALDVLRVIGNHAVHPGEYSEFDDEKTALALFSVLNHIAEKMISEPKTINTLYSALNQDVVDQIKMRNQKIAKIKNSKVVEN